MLLVKDSGKRFGLVSIILHWVNAFAIFVLLPTGVMIRVIEPHHRVYIPLRDNVGWIHTSVAMLALPFFIARIFWRARYGKPKAPPQHWALKATADGVWMLLLACIACQIVTGPFIGLLHQKPLHIFGLVTLVPAVFERNNPLFAVMYQTHWIAALAIGALLFLHIGGALKHFVIDRDGVLERMLTPIEKTLGLPVPAKQDKEFKSPEAVAGE